MTISVEVRVPNTATYLARVERIHEISEDGYSTKEIRYLKPGAVEHLAVWDQAGFVITEEKSVRGIDVEDGYVHPDGSTNYGQNPVDPTP